MLGHALIFSHIDLKDNERSEKSRVSVVFRFTDKMSKSQTPNGQNVERQNVECKNAEWDKTSNRKTPNWTKRQMAKRRMGQNAE